MDVYIIGHAVHRAADVTDDMPLEENRLSHRAPGTRIKVRFVDAPQGCVTDFHYALA